MVPISLLCFHFMTCLVRMFVMFICNSISMVLYEMLIVYCTLLIRARLE